MAAQAEAERAKEIAEAAHERLYRLESALKALDGHNPVSSVRAAQDILNDA